ncbi:MAG: aspartate--tRNA ligase [Chitinivibrionales bacterium]|nr:aspartate--tRNA ligase [Chitinivibrionales bacterium]
MHEFRTHTCGQLRKAEVGQTVRISGWIHNKRDHGGVLFIDVRDNYGITQVVVYPDQQFQYDLGHLPRETVIRCDGTVRFRSAENINPKMATGEIEIEASGYEVLGTCDQLPFTVFQEEDVPEEIRLRYRYLDLRRSQLHKNILLRSAVIQRIRSTMISLGFCEFQTPILTSSSPEGARDYLVPSRIHPGKFYALPQAPQQFKQLLMIAGYDRYFQIAPCFRDEDARADRSPGEFYQLDLEMSFATQEDIFKVVETVFQDTFSAFSTFAMDTPPFTRITYKDSLLRYGTDKPDLRIPLEIVDCSEVFAQSQFNAFREAVKEGEVVRCICVKGIADKPRNFFDKLVEYATTSGAKGLAYIIRGSDKVKGPIVKFLSEQALETIFTTSSAAVGDALFFICDKEKKAARLAGDLRVKLGRDLDMVQKDAYRFCWIVDFPMYELNEETGKIEFSHNPFSMPQGGLETLLNDDPLSIKAYQYDIVCNGIELSSGAIRNHQPEVMYKAFEIAGYDKQVVDEHFPALVNAFHFGAPPHGGIAPGIDRMVMLLAQVSNLREVIAFPMNQKAQDLLMNAPAQVSEEQLRELHIRLRTV